tara:strand:+ start:4718 stop:4915 length:198 start_codon:yes stop_codon:yes gene_type:complete
MKKTSKKDKVLAHLMTGQSITPIEALTEYGSFRLGAIIFDLRAEGYSIDTEIAKGTGHAIYTLNK